MNKKRQYGKYELRKNKFGKFFIKNNKYWYIDSLEVFGLDPSLRYDTIEYNFYKVKFEKENGKEYITLRKTQSPLERKV